MNPVNYGPLTSALFWDPCVLQSCDHCMLCLLGTFTSGSQLVCLYEQNAYTLEPGKIQVRNFQVSHVNVYVCIYALHYMFLVIYSKQSIFGLTQEWFREWSFSGLECGVHDRLHIYPMCGIFYFPWHTLNVSFERHRETVSNDESQFLTCLVWGSNPDRQRARRAC